MPRFEPLPPLYAILDPELAGKRRPADVLLQILQGGAKLVQLRAKRLSSRDFLELAREFCPLMRSFGSRLIINDRVDIALACGADGVHLGQDDLPLGAAKKLMSNGIVGVSTHDPAQAREAERAGADYIGFGPMFGTSTKETGYSARGIEMLREVRTAVKLPIVAIGGITEQSVGEVWQAGADSAAIISDILRADEPAEKVRRILALGQRA